VIFWVLVAALYFFNYTRIASSQAWLFVLKDLFVIMSIFYITTSFVISKWLLEGKILLVLGWIVFTYVWWLLNTYGACVIAINYLSKPNTYWERYLELVTSNGLLSLLDYQRIPVFILDFIYLISLPLGPKFMKSLMEQANEKTKLERDNLALELDFLKSQISPHFLFNTLNNIYQMAKKNDSQTPETILQLADMMRYLLYESKREKMPLKQEVKFIRDYIELARIRYDNKFILAAEIRDSNEPYKIAPLLLIPFVENAFKHGPDRSKKNGWVNIAITVKNDVLLMKIDNGVNRSADKAVPGGLGLENVKRRLSLNYPEMHRLQIQKEDTSFHVSLELNLK